jgi:hypothetical protein
MHSFLRSTASVSALAAFVAASPLSAQSNTFPASGNVGIGTTNPSSKVQIIDGTGVGSGLLVQAGYPYGAGTYPSILKLKDKDNQYELFTVNSDGSFAFNRGPDRVLTGAATGNIGVGTASPQASLDIWKAYSAGTDSLRFSYNDGSAYWMGIRPYVVSAGNVGYLFRTNNGTTTTDAMAITGVGNVGIGTAVPYAPLEVAVKGGTNDVRLGFYIGRQTTGVAAVGMGVSSRFYLEDAGGALIETNGIASVWTDPSAANRAARMDFYSSKNNTSSVAMSIGSTGYVGIGTTNPTNKLEVNGTIRAKEVIVETTGWSDYVFAPDYKLAPLSEVEAHIQAKGTLPGIPSAAEVAEHGVSVGDLQAKLLAKMEEMTLHLIAQEKGLAELRAENARLQEEVAALKKD